MVTVDFIEIFNIPMILFIGLITSYQDRKFNKIRNKWIIISLGYSLISLFIVSLFVYIKGNPINYDYFVLYGTNLFISLCFGFFIYMCGLWSPGDAKLFLAYSALVPLSIYRWGLFDLFPSYILLINTFTPIFIMYFFQILISVKPKLIVNEIRKMMNIKFICSFILMIFGLSYIGNFFFKITGLQGNLILNSLILVAVMLIFNRNYLFLVSLVLSIIRLLFDQFSADFFTGFFIQGVLVLLIKYLILNLSFYSLSKPIYIEEIKAKMCLAENYISNKGAIRKTRRFRLSFFDFVKEDSVLENHKCLTESDVTKLKRLHSQGKIKDHVTYIYERVYFALFMFIGSMITIILRGNVVVWIASLI